MSEEQFSTSEEFLDKYPEYYFQCSVCGLYEHKQVEVCTSCKTFILDGIAYPYQEIKKEIDSLKENITHLTYTYEAEIERLKKIIEKSKRCYNCKFYIVDIYLQTNVCDIVLNNNLDMPSCQYWELQE